MLKAEVFIQFRTGDVPRIHPGYRGVAVKLMGRKWVHCVLTERQKPFKILRKRWDLLHKTPVKTENVID